MEWQLILALAITIPIILIPVAFIWYLNIGGIYAAIKEREFKVFERIGRAMRTAAVVIVSVSVYASLLWFFLGHLGWQVALALGLALPIILFPVAFIWYLNIGGIYAAIRQGVRIRIFETTGRVARTAVIVIVPAGVYASLIWFFLGHLGWQVALALGLALPVAFFVPVLIWAAVVSGLYVVIRDRMRRRLTAPRRTATRMAEETVARKVT